MSLLFGYFKKVVEKCQQLFAKFGYFLFFAILFDNF